MSRADETFLDLALSRSTVDRSAVLRTDQGAVAAALRDPGTRLLLLRDGRAPVIRLPRPALALRAPTPEDVDRELWLLGVREGTTYLALTEDGAEPASEDVTWAGLRQVGADLDDTDAGLLTTATALHEWHRRHGHCTRCGTPTTVEQGGWVRRCPVDASEHHPRTDPAVIMAVTDPSDRLLLGSGATWPDSRMSVLAGFVEAGESLEAAVIREVHEEVGLGVTGLTYRGNQPWPFPASLMLGFRATTEDTELTVDRTELSTAAWFTRAQLRDAVETGRVTLPTRVSIARRLIEDWYGQELHVPGEGAS